MTTRDDSGVSGNGATMSGGSDVTVLQLAGISAGYGQTVVLREVAIEVPPRSIVALLGPNGAGKTTLLRVASGLLRPAEGTVSIMGEDVTSASPNARARAGLCLIPEGRGVFPSLTVSENLLLHTPPWMREDRLERALTAFPALRPRMRQVAGSLSGGQQQMLALARIHLSDPKVVLVDEVSMGLAPLVVSEIFDTLNELAMSGISILLVEQFVTRALEMANAVYVLNRGQITFSGAPSEIDERTLLQSYLGAELEGS